MLPRHLVQPGGLHRPRHRIRPPPCAHDWVRRLPHPQVPADPQTGSFRSHQPQTDPNKPTTSSRSPWPLSVPECNPHLALGACGVLLPQAVCVTSKLRYRCQGSGARAGPSPTLCSPARCEEIVHPGPSVHEKALPCSSAQDPAPRLCTSPRPEDPAGPEAGAPHCCPPLRFPFSMKQFSVPRVLCRNKAVKASRD